MLCAWRKPEFFGRIFSGSACANFLKIWMNEQSTVGFQTNVSGLVGWCGMSCVRTCHRQWNGFFPVSSANTAIGWLEAERFKKQKRNWRRRANWMESKLHTFTLASVDFNFNTFLLTKKNDHLKLDPKCFTFLCGSRCMWPLVMRDLIEILYFQKYNRILFLVFSFFFLSLG